MSFPGNPSASSCFWHHPLSVQHQRLGEFSAENHLDDETWDRDDRRAVQYPPQGLDELAVVTGAGDTRSGSIFSVFIYIRNKRIIIVIKIQQIFFTGGGARIFIEI